MFLERLLAVHM